MHLTRVEVVELLPEIQKSYITAVEKETTTLTLPLPVI